MTASFTELWAGVALTINDVLALFSLLGSILVFLTALLSLAKQERIRFSERALQWSIMGLVFGIGGQLCLNANPQIKADMIGFIARMPISIVNVLFVASFGLLLLGFMIRRTVH